MSPNEQKITSGRAAMAMGLVDHLERRDADRAARARAPARSRCGSSSSMPNLTMECVCPPQTSISVHGRVTVRAIGRRELPAHPWRRGIRPYTSCGPLVQNPRPGRLSPSDIRRPVFASASSTVLMAKPHARAHSPPAWRPACTPDSLCFTIPPKLTLAVRVSGSSPLMPRV